MLTQFGSGSCLFATVTRKSQMCQQTLGELQWAAVHKSRTHCVIPKVYIYTLGITQCVLDLCTAAHCNSPRVCWHIWLFLVTVANRHDPDPNWVNTGQSYINGDKVLTTDDEPSLSLEVDSCTNNLISFFLTERRTMSVFCWLQWEQDLFQHSITRPFQ